ncbi:Murein DD-endopeptidase MepM and murein hydrolase activator NlpD, contain LysM domain [Fontibacillus panacisegetis]|uniref:Murein DD-endopeptidase MepM and murein hydrolase activator NlpD, contain LysM domain n=1 Tax=Fontibacillus panacisegetis TaxID=670482 RepID=A0A1G7LD57_9BACL|nr:M23 family metallopeptidase [Fontibacillus panacisegetis]SDF47502.1 Murein DD-endopeptidase MepM and murein hydrolase activator NlpD, contain LysM domain [Fontibacillus panacisegetis]
MKGFKERWNLLRRGGYYRAQENHDRPENDQQVSKLNIMKKVRESISRSSLTRTKRIVIGSIAGLFIVGSAYLTGRHYVDANTMPYYRVFIGDQEIGSIKNLNDLNALYTKKEQEYKQKYPDVEMAVHTEGVTTVQEKKYKAEINSEETLDKVYSMLTGYAKGVELHVDGKVIGIVKDQATADAVLEQLKNKYTPATTASKGIVSKIKRTGGLGKNSSGTSGTGNNVELESVKFNEEIAKVGVDTDPNKVMDVDAAVERILAGDEAAITYEVREGDTISSIAKRFSITQKELYANNPEVKELTLQIGTLISVKAVQPSITVRTVERVTEEIVTEPQVIIRKSESMRAGEAKVIAQGQSGLKTMEYRLTKENGEVVAEEWLGQEVTKASRPKIVLKGTKVVLGEGSGDFAWPVSGAAMSSSYGQRWGRTHKGIDLVSSNRSILASDDGVVTFAGTKSGYGNCIIIDHNNGYQTLYGHLSKISVKEGEIIEKGSKIGVMGNTGRSTGTHLHFEIHKNGSIQNPMKYL